MIGSFAGNVAPISELLNLRPWAVYYTAIDAISSECRARSGAMASSEREIVEYAIGLPSYGGELIGLHEKLLLAALKDDQSYLEAIGSLQRRSTRDICEGASPVSLNGFQENSSLSKDLAERRVDKWIRSLNGRGAILILHASTYCGSSTLMERIPLHDQSMSCDVRIYPHN
jgi:hypothetical protein